LFLMMNQIKAEKSWKDILNRQVVKNKG